VNYASAEQKKLKGSWKVLRLQKRNKRKKGGKRKSAQEDSGFLFTLASIAKTALDWFTKILLTGALAYGIYLGYQYVTTSPQFEISQVTLTGNQKLPEKELREWLGPVTGENIFLLDLENLSTRLAKHSWIQSVSVRKVFPQDIVVDVKERNPYARIKLDRVYVMDNFGILLAPETSAYRHLPLIIQPWSGEKIELGKNAVLDDAIQSLKHMHYLNKMSFFADNPINTVGIDDFSRVTFTSGDGRLNIFMGLETIALDFNKFQIVSETLEKDRKNIEHIDLSFKDKIVVKQITRS
jgi:cell division protein FtsQ